MNLMERENEKATRNSNKQLDLIQKEMLEQKNAMKQLQKLTLELKGDILKHITETVKNEVGGKLYDIERDVKKTVKEIKQSVYANPQGIVFLILIGIGLTIGSGKIMNYKNDRKLARKTLESEKARIEKNAIAEYKNQLLNDAYGIGILELEIQNVKKNKNVWKNPDVLIEKLNEDLRDRIELEKHELME